MIRNDFAGIPTLLMPEAPLTLLQSHVTRNARFGRVPVNMPGLPKEVVSLNHAPSSAGEETCGACDGYVRERGNYCKERNILVRPADPGCPFFLPAVEHF
jgi:hypothetical protein